MNVLFRLQPISQWTSTNVVEWMAALNLYRYAELFRSKDIKGVDLLSLDKDKLMVSSSSSSSSPSSFSSSFSPPSYKCLNLRLIGINPASWIFSLNPKSKRIAPLSNSQGWLPYHILRNQHLSDFYTNVVVNNHGMRLLLSHTVRINFTFSPIISVVQFITLN